MRQVTRKSLMTVAAATGVIAAAGGYAHADSAANGSATDSPGVLSGNSVQAPVNVPVNVCGNTVDVIGILNPSMGNACSNQGGGSTGGYGDHRSHGGHKGHGGQGSHSGSQGGYGGDQGGYGGSGNHGGPGSHSGSGSHGGSGAHGGSGGAHAGGHTGGSPGVGSGNHVQAPIDVPVNVCGNSVDVVGLLNPTLGNDCANGGGSEGRHHGTPPVRGHETPAGPGHQGPGRPGEHGRSSASGPESAPSTPDRVTPARATNGHLPAAPQLAHTGAELPIGFALPAGAGALLAGALIYRKARPGA
ncbi:hypothetical protein JCM4814A_56000 [Streptomyces phaeofaciens JCM 4814]|uniref:Secreted protein n=1 Tax=Streptomyces phaeofaciens TaxID=68254 RepID=A0A918HR59_9ACTN|nr:chaplin [Streptomyces phaeofaciens]GGT96369.1 hypothetical protein GCM10010226_87410 [Streptomyces phaeofaciens]